MLRGREQDDPAGLADGERGLGVAAEEEALDADDGRAVELDQLAHRLVDRVAAGPAANDPGSW